MRNVFIYWVGTEFKFIKILRDLIYLHSNDQRSYVVNFLNDKNISLYIPNLPNDFFKLNPAHQADYARVNVVCNYGGIWLDSDTIVMDDLSRLFEILEEKDGFFIRENNEHLCNGVFGSRANTPLMRDWLDTINSRLQSSAEINWTELGAANLNRMLKESPQYYDNYTIFNGLDTMYPVNWSQCSEEYLRKPYDNYKKYIREFQPLIILTNSVYRDLEPLSEEEILNGNRPINYFINTSRGMITEGFSSNHSSTNDYLPFLYILCLIALIYIIFLCGYRKKIVLPTITLSLPLSKWARCIQ